MNANQYRILEFIDDHWKKHYRPPTVREIMDGADISSTSVVTYHLAQLRKSGDLIKIKKGLHPRVSNVIPPWVKRAIDQYSDLSGDG